MNSCGTMPKTPEWTEPARQDLRELRERIAQNAPRGAREYVRKLKNEVSALRRFPALGAVIEDLGEPELRELIFDRYRVIYRFDGKVIEILRVWPAAKPLRLDRLESE